MRRNWLRSPRTLSWPSAALAPLLQVTRTVPIVFTIVADPVGAGYVEGLARPGGNATGFTNFEYGIAGKWLELLKEIAPGVTRVAVLQTAKAPKIFARVGNPTQGQRVQSSGEEGAIWLELAAITLAYGDRV
jgi:ABC transporter substrate binding protein